MYLEKKKSKVFFPENGNSESLEAKEAFLENRKHYLRKMLI